MAHKSSKVLLAGIQDLAQFCARPDSLLVGIPSSCKKRKLFNEGSSVFTELVHRFGVRCHGWRRQWLPGENLLRSGHQFRFLGSAVAVGINQRFAGGVQGHLQGIGRLLRGELWLLRTYWVIWLFPHALHSFASFNSGGSGDSAILYLVCADSEICSDSAASLS